MGMGLEFAGDGEGRGRASIESNVLSWTIWDSCSSSGKNLQDLVLVLV